MGNKINLCIIPAAGKGTRWSPITNYFPKEMLPLLGRPVIDWTILEAINSGCTDIIVVISKQKEVIRKYLERDSGLEDNINIKFIYQAQPLGIAHAMYLARKFTGDLPFVVALPDLPTLSRIPVIKQLVNAFYKDSENPHVVSFDEFSPEISHLYGECLFHFKKAGILDIIHFCPKQTDPKTPHHKGNFVRMSGKFIFTPDIFPVIEKLLLTRPDGEISDRTCLRASYENGKKVIGFKIKGKTVDTGYPSGYVYANQSFHNHFAKEI